MTKVYHAIQLPLIVTRFCTSCLTEKSLNDFYKGCYRCKTCEQARRKQVRQERVKALRLTPLSPDTTKVCTKCLVEKPLNEFYEQGSGKLGRNPQCKKCVIAINVQARRQRGRKPYQRRTPRKPLPQNGGKVCSKCLVEKPHSKFHKNKRTKDGYYPFCKACKNVGNGECLPLPEALNGGKVCTKCLIEKPLEDFSKEMRRQGGYGPRCKECHNSRNREKYATGNKEQKLQKNREWYETHKEAHHKMTREWRQTHKHKNTEYGKKRYALTKGATVGDVDYERIFENSDNFCYICEGIIKPEHTTEFDHVIPVTRGGSHTEDNIRVVHKTCNRRKINKLLSEMTPYQRRGVD